MVIQTVAGYTGTYLHVQGHIPEHEDEFVQESFLVAIPITTTCIL
jgi:hypothetical protein